MNSLAEKIASASRAVGALATDKRNTQQNYDYISADKVLERAGNALADVGVALIPSITGEEMMVHPTANGKERFDARVTFSMILTDGETTLEFPWIGRGSDYSVPDKATYKAITSGHKYLLMKLLNIGVGNEDGEHEVEPPQRSTRNEGVTRPPLNREEDGQVLRAGKLPARVAPDDELTDENFGMKDNPRVDLNKFAILVHNVHLTIPKGAFACITHLRERHHASSEPMSANAYGTLVGYTDKIVGDGQPVHGMVLSAICGTEIDRNNRPGSQVSEMIDWLSDPKTFVNKVAILKQILGLCRQVEKEMADA